MVSIISAGFCCFFVCLSLFPHKRTATGVLIGHRYCEIVGCFHLSHPPSRYCGVHVTEWRKLKLDLPYTGYKI